MIFPRQTFIEQISKSLKAGGACPAPTNAVVSSRRGRACPARSEPPRTKLNNGIGPPGCVARASAPRPPTGLAALILLVLLSLGSLSHSFERTEARAPCRDFDANRQALFGDLHVHSSFSFDAYISSLRASPWDAYRYAKGKTIEIPAADGERTIRARISRRLDFAAVTDHAEYLGQIDVCTADPGRAGFWWPHCVMTRSSGQWTQLLAMSWWTQLAGQEGDNSSYSFACTLSDCESAGQDAWQRIQQAAEDHYDRSEACEFTTFIGYEYSDSLDQKNMHRNVIFRNEQVTHMPISTYETGRGNFPALWTGLREQCIDQPGKCDVMSIPHNPNLAAGLMFRDPESQAELNDRVFFEPLVELIQHKGESECRFDRLVGAGVGTEDELCNFEQVPSDSLAMLGTVNGVVRTERALLTPVDEFARRNLVRNVYKDGLAYGQANGTNPFVMGVIGSTDTHSALPGGTDEDDYLGHLGRRDSEFRNVQDHFYSNPGGHAVVWAEENSRDSIFEALRRKETYATSGTRPKVRFFGGGELSEDLCENPNAVAEAYETGVPMGGHITESDEPPKFLVIAHKDPGIEGNPGTDLERIQIIKGWVDEQGNTHEHIFDVVGGPNGAGVDPRNCQRVGSGAKRLCGVWQDLEFDPSQPAFYYARVLENPTCRWSTLQCQAAGVNPFSDHCAAESLAANERAYELGAEGDVYGKCCLREAEQAFYSPLIQERAWTSPIWYKQAQ